jgi:dihydropteroate synthase
MTINCKGQLIDLTTPKVMGILNVTPNSFFDGGKYNNESDLLNQVGKMISDGATFIDKLILVNLVQSLFQRMKN